MKDRVLRRVDRPIRRIKNTSAMKGNITDLNRLSRLTHVFLHKFSAFHHNNFSDCSRLNFDAVQLRMLIPTFLMSFLHSC